MNYFHNMFKTITDAYRNSQGKRYPVGIEAGMNSYNFQKGLYNDHDHHMGVVPNIH